MRSKSYKEDSDSKGSKKPRRGKSNKKDFREAKLDPRGRDNDPNFYFTSPELAEQAAQLSFQNVLGLGGIDGYKIPSICRVLLNPCPGVSYRGLGFTGDVSMDIPGYPSALDDSKHGINLMASKLYTMLSTFTGRTSQYAPQDVAMMVLAISSISELSEHIRRMFGIMLTYNPRNRTLPLGLLRSMGIDVSDFMSHIPDYRMRFNVCMTRINQIPLLDNIAYIKKSREIYQRVYMDDLSPMAQVFYYAPSTVWKLDESSDEHGSVLIPQLVTYSGVTKTVGELITLLNSMITVLLESSTLNLIYADLLNMANKIKVPVWQFDYLAENYVVMPEFNRNAMLQFHHLRVIGYPIGMDSGIADRPYACTKAWRVDKDDESAVTPYEMTITSANAVVCDPDHNNVVYNPVFVDYSYTKTVVDMDTPTPTLEDKIEALRFSVTSSGCKVVRSEITASTAYGPYLEFLPSLPDHYAVSLTIYDNIDYTQSETGAQLCDFRNTVTMAFSDLYALAAIEKFKHHPFLYDMIRHESKLYKLFGDVDFYTVVDYDYLNRVNEMMYTGLFDFRV